MMITAAEFCERTGIKRATVSLWRRQGKLPGAQLVTLGPLSYWEIPGELVGKVERGKSGRPKSNAAGPAD